MKVVLLPNERGNPPGKLADAEVHFHPEDGILTGLKLIGFAIWQRRDSADCNVTFPARQYSVSGERRSFALLRPISDSSAQEPLRACILKAWDDYQNGR